MVDGWTPREVAKYFPVSIPTVNRMVSIAIKADWTPPANKVDVDLSRFFGSAPA